MIRAITIDDKKQFIDLVKEFCDEHLDARGFKFNREKCEKDFDLFANLKDTIALCVEEDGKMQGVVCAFVMAKPFFGKLAAAEMIWYVRKDQRKNGIKLLHVFERVCEERGCEEIVMVALKDTKIEGIYERLNYNHVESSYVKTIKGD